MQCYYDSAIMKNVHHFNVIFLNATVKTGNQLTVNSHNIYSEK